MPNCEHEDGCRTQPIIYTSERLLFSMENNTLRNHRNIFLKQVSLSSLSMELPICLMDLSPTTIKPYNFRPELQIYHILCVSHWYFLFSWIILPWMAGATFLPASFLITPHSIWHSDLSIRGKEMLRKWVKTHQSNKLSHPFFLSPHFKLIILHIRRLRLWESNLIVRGDIANYWQGFQTMLPSLYCYFWERKL